MIRLWSEAQVSSVDGYVSYLLEHLNLSDWEVVLNHEPADMGNSSAGASIAPTYGRKTATLKLCLEFFTFPVQRMEHFLTHEICHLLSAHLDDVIDNGPEQLMGKPAFSIFHHSYVMHNERMIDHIATFVQELLADGERRSELAAALEAVRV